jgi:hypothetical protein
MPTTRPTIRTVGGKGLDADYELKRARKAYRCTHMAAHGHYVSLECFGDIQPGDYYVRTRQSWIDYDPVNLACLVAAEVLEVVPAETPAPDC